MEERDITAAIEAILFAMGNSVEISQIAEALEIEEDRAWQAVESLNQRYRENGSGLQIHRYDDAVQLSTRADQYKYLIKIAKVPKKQVLTNALLETLSIIAYKQPATRMDVEHVRGVNSDHLLFGTTEQFLRTFGIESLDELPETDAVKMEEFRQEAEEEAGTRLDI